MSRAAPLSPFILIGLAILCTCSAVDKSGVTKKRMPDLRCAYLLDQEDFRGYDASIARAMAMFAADPEAFGDPVAIVNPMPDSVGKGRRIFGLVVTGANWLPEAGIGETSISGGKALSIGNIESFSAIDSCWQALISYAQANNYEISPPGIELFRGYNSESNQTSIELIVRIN